MIETMELGNFDVLATVDFYKAKKEIFCCSIKFDRDFNGFQYVGERLNIVTNYYFYDKGLSYIIHDDVSFNVKNGVVVLFDTFKIIEVDVSRNYISVSYDIKRFGGKKDWLRCKKYFLQYDIKEEKYERHLDF